MINTRTYHHSLVFFFPPFVSPVTIPNHGYPSPKSYFINVVSLVKIPNNFKNFLNFYFRSFSRRKAFFMELLLTFLLIYIRALRSTGRQLFIKIFYGIHYKPPVYYHPIYYFIAQHPICCRPNVHH